MERACVFDVTLQSQLKPHMVSMVPRKSLYCTDFIAANQASRADNLLTGNKMEAVEQIRRDIRDFKEKKKLDKVQRMIILCYFPQYIRMTACLFYIHNCVHKLGVMCKINCESDFSQSYTYTHMQ